jgi:hypothetical protein
MNRRAATLVVYVAAILLIAGLLDVVLAQGNPFGVPRGSAPKGPPPAPPGGIFAWVIAKQNEFYRQFSGLIRAAKADGSAVWGLLGVSFLYGIFQRLERSRVCSAPRIPVCTQSPTLWPRCAAPGTRRLSRWIGRQPTPRNPRA